MAYKILLKYFFLSFFIFIIFFSIESYYSVIFFQNVKSAVEKGLRIETFKNDLLEINFYCQHLKIFKDFTFIDEIVKNSKKMNLAQFEILNPPIKGISTEKVKLLNN